MARTAPAPNIPPIPGMCPSIAVLAGGGDGGGGSGGSAGDGSGDNNAGAGKGGENAEADGRGAPDYQKYPECGYASHPVDVVTGRAFTHPIVDLELPGPLPLRFARMYSSKLAGRDAGLGFGWGHTFGWEIEVQRRRITVWNEQGIGVDFPVIPQGAEVIGPWGWVLRREAWGFSVDADDGLWHLFSAAEDEGKRWRLTAIEDRNRNRIALTYEDGRLVEVKDSAGRTIRVVPTREGRIGSIQVQNAISQGKWVALATYTYDERGDLISAMDADGFASRYAYDEDHRLSADTDRSGLCFHFGYDGEGRCVESWGDYPGKRDPSLVDAVPKYLYDGRTPAKGIHHCKFEYGPDDTSEVIDSTQVRRFFGTRHGTLSKSVQGSAVMTAVYRDDGHLLARTDAAKATTHFERDARGRVLKLTDPLGRATVIDRDAAGLAVQVVDATGAVTRMERDARGNVLVHEDAIGGVTAYEYDARGLVTTIVDPRGSRTTCTYDDHGNRVTITEANGATWRYTYDALGRRLVEVDPLGAEARYAYSARGDLVSIHDTAGGVTRYAYDGEGHLIAVTDPAGGITSVTWGGYHKLCAQRDASGGEIRFRYNLEGELVEMHDPRGAVHRFEHDPSGRLVGETTFDGRRILYKNDALGRPIQITDGRGQKTKLTYDLAGQLVERELADGAVESFEYDAAGRVVVARGPTCELRLTRDPLGRVAREIQVVGGDEQSVEITYDPAGGRAARTTSAGHTEAIERDATGARRRTVLDGTHAIEHGRDPLGREIARALPGGGRIESVYDTMGRLVQRRALDASTQRRVGRDEPEWLGARDEGATAATAYRYDANGELRDAWDRQRGHTSYAYDPIGRLLSMVPEKARAEVFRYDPAGNLHEGASGAESRAYGEGNQLLRRGDTTYRWNEAGELIEKRIRAVGGAEQVWSYRWSAAGLMESVTAPDGTVVDFAYDPLARRVQKRVSVRQPSGRTVPVTLTRFVWDGDALVHEITERARAGGDPVVEVRTYCFADDGISPAAHRDGAGSDGGAWFHYVNDPIGAPERLVAGDGKIACELQRAAWGAAGVAPGSLTKTPIRLPGQYADEETGLHYNRFRYYDPDAGRFTSADPLGLGGGSNAYAYALNPFTSADPLGLKATDLPVLKPGSPAWKQQVKDMKSPGGGKDCRVATQEDAERLLREGRGDLPRKGSAEDPYNNNGEPYKKGYEVHPNEEHTQNAPHNNLPHVKWKDWSDGKKAGGTGHIFFG